MVSKVYEGRFGYEHFLYEINEEDDIVPDKGDFIFFDDEIYKVMYVMFDYDNGGYNIFARKTTEEDF